MKISSELLQFFAGLVVVLIVVVYLDFYDHQHELLKEEAAIVTKRDQAKDRQHQIYDACKEAVLEKLKAPGTAVFSSFDEIVIDDSGPEVYVSGWVDSQNGFGALLRKRWKAQLHDEKTSLLLKPLVWEVTFSDW